MTADGSKTSKLPSILLNGNNVCMLIPGGEGPASATIQKAQPRGVPMSKEEADKAKAILESQS